MRDETLLESALGKPKNIFAYEEESATLARLAASYAFGIARNHVFVDGNKRTALVVCLGFLRFNGMTFTATREERYIAFLTLAAGEMTETQMTEWLERYIVRFNPLRSWNHQKPEAAYGTLCQADCQLAIWRR